MDRRAGGLGFANRRREASAGPEGGSGSASGAESPGADTRSELLGAGARLYADPSQRLLRDLTPKAVADEAGFHRQTFYRYWDTHEQYIENLIEFVFDPVRAPVADGVLIIPDRRQAAGVTFEDVAADIARYDLARQGSDPLQELRVGLWSLRPGRPGLERRILAYHEHTVDVLAEGYERFFARWDREPVLPCSCRDIAVGLDTLLQGIVTRPAYGSALSIEELYVLLAGELLGRLSRPTAPPVPAD